MRLSMGRIIATGRWQIADGCAIGARKMGSG
jgi:hypothetical protein